MLHLLVQNPVRIGNLIFQNQDHGHQHHGLHSKSQETLHPAGGKLS